MKIYKLSSVKYFSEINKKVKYFWDQKELSNNYNISINKYFFKMFEIEEEKKNELINFNENFKNIILNNHRVMFDLINNYLSYEKKYGFDENFLEALIINIYKYLKIQGDHPILGIDYMGKRLFDSSKWIQIEDTICYSLQNGIETDYSKSKKIINLLSKLNIKSNKIKTAAFNNIKSKILNKVISEEKYGCYKNNFYLDNNFKYDRELIQNTFLDYFNNIKKNLEFEKELTLEDNLKNNIIEEDEFEGQKENFKEILNDINNLSNDINTYFNSNIEIISIVNYLRELYYKLLEIQKEKYILKNKNIVLDIYEFEEKLLELGIINPKDVYNKNNDFKNYQLENILSEFGSNLDLLNKFSNLKEINKTENKLFINKENDFDFFLFCYEYIDFLNNQIDGEHKNITRIKELFGISFDVENFKELGVLNEWDYFKDNLYFDLTFIELKNLVKNNYSNLLKKFKNNNEKIKLIILLSKLNLKNLSKNLLSNILTKYFDYDLEFDYSIELLKNIINWDTNSVDLFKNSELFIQISKKLIKEYDNLDLIKKIEYFGHLIYFSDIDIIKELLLNLSYEINNDYNLKEILKGNDRDFKIPLKPFHKSFFNLLLYYKSNKININNDLESEILYLINLDNKYKNLNDPIKFMLIKVFKSNIEANSSKLIENYSNNCILSYFNPDLFINNKNNELIGIFIEGSNVVGKNSNLENVYKYNIIENLSNKILKNKIDINYSYKIVGYDYFIELENYSVFDLKRNFNYDMLNKMINNLQISNSKIILNDDLENNNLNDDILKILNNKSLIEFINNNKLFKKYFYYLQLILELNFEKSKKDSITNTNSLIVINDKIKFIKFFIEKLLKTIPEDYLKLFNSELKKNNLKKPLDIIDEIIKNSNNLDQIENDYKFIGKRIGINLIEKDSKDYKIYEEFIDADFLKNDNYFLFNNWENLLKNKINLLTDENKPKIYNYYSTIKNISIPKIFNENNDTNLKYNFLWESFYYNQDLKKNLKYEKYNKNSINLENLSLNDKFKINLMNLNYDLKLIKNYDEFLKNLFQTDFLKELTKFHVEKYTLNNKLLEDLIEENINKNDEEEIIFNLSNIKVKDYNYLLNENKNKYIDNNEYFEKLEKENLIKKKLQFWHKILYYKLPFMRKNLKTMTLKKEYKKIKNYVKKNYFLSMKEYKNNYLNSDFYNDENKNQERIFGIKYNKNKKEDDNKYYKTKNEFRISAENNLIKSSIIYNILNDLKITNNQNKFIKIWSKYLEMNPLNYNEIISNNLNLMEINQLSENDTKFFNKFLPHFNISNFSNFYMNDIIVIINLFLNKNIHKIFETQLLKKSYCNLDFNTNNIFKDTYLSNYSNNYKFLIDYNDKNIFKNNNNLDLKTKKNIIKLFNFKRGKSVYDEDWKKIDEKSLNDFLNKIEKKYNKWNYLNIWFNRKEKEIKQRGNYFIKDFMKKDEDLKNLIDDKNKSSNYLNNILEEDISNYDSLKLQNLVDQIISKIKILTKHLPLNIDKIIIPILNHPNLHLLDKIKLINHLKYFNIDLESLNKNKFLFEKDVEINSFEIEEKKKEINIIEDLKKIQNINLFIGDKLKNYLNNN